MTKPALAPVLNPLQEAFDASANIRQRSDAEARSIYATIRELIGSGRLEAGDRLPTEKVLCRTYAASRHTVRKAMSRLEREDLVERTVGRGSFVKRPATAEAGQPAGAAAVRGWTLAELTEARLVMEPHIAALAVERAADDDLAGLELRMTAIAATTDWPGFKEAKYAFHRGVVEAAKNPFLVFMFDQIIATRRASAWNRHHSVNVSIDATRAMCLVECRSILEALKNRNARAVEAAIRSALNRILIAVNEF